MNLPALNFGNEEKHQQGPKLPIDSSETTAASHEVNTYIQYIHKNYYRAPQDTFLSSAQNYFNINFATHY